MVCLYCILEFLFPSKSKTIGIFKAISLASCAVPVVKKRGLSVGTATASTYLGYKSIFVIECRAEVFGCD